MKILLAIDDSAGSEAAARAVMEQFPEQDTEVKVLHVVEPPSSSLKFVAKAAEQLVAAATGQMEGCSVSLTPELEAASKQAQLLVGKATDDLRLQGFTAIGSVESGDPKSLIIDAAAKWHADLIVVGAHGRNRLERFLMGSVSEAVARHAGCSVEIVRARSSRG